MRCFTHRSWGSGGWRRLRSQDRPLFPGMYFLNEIFMKTCIAPPGGCCGSVWAIEHIGHLTEPQQVYLGLFRRRRFREARRDMGFAPEFYRHIRHEYPRTEIKARNPFHVFCKKKSSKRCLSVQPNSAFQRDRELWGCSPWPPTVGNLRCSVSLAACHYWRDSARGPSRKCCQLNGTIKDPPGLAPVRC